MHSRTESSDVPTPVSIEELTASSSSAVLHQAHELLLEYGRFVVAQPGAARFCFGSLEQEAARLPHSYIEQNGGCLIAYVDNQPAGFVAWRTLPATVAPTAWELKRLWVRPVARGLALGRALTQAAIDRAIAAGQTALYLDLGFEPCPPYNDNPVEGLAWLRKSL